MAQLAGSKNGLLASLLLWSLLLSVSASNHTHQCRIHIDGETQAPPVLQLQCWPLQQQDADHTLNKEPCRLKLFYNSTNVAVNDPSTFGIEAGTLPVEGSEVPPYTEAVLNRTEYGEQDGKRTQFVSWPLLYFHGGPGCNLLLDKPVIHRVNLPYKPRRATQALAFGGGLSATITGGRFSNITSNLGILVLARSRLYISDTILANNSLSKGALYVSHNGSLFALSNVTLSGNTAEAEGTALYVNHGAAEMLNSTFSSNTAHSGGGAVHAKAGGTLNLINTTFDGNVAGNGSEAFGGALYVMDSHVSATNCTFANNVATRGAGAIYLGMATPPNATDRCQYRDLPRRLVIKGSTFQGNVAPIGGALAVFYAAVFIHNSTFTVNRARILQVESLKLAKVLQQSSEYYTLGVGGAIYADNAVVDVQHSYFTSNVAVMDGGALRVQRGHTNISNTFLAENRAHRHGGAVFVGTVGIVGPQDKPEALMQDIKECYTDQERPVLSLLGSNVTNNTAEASGGALMLQPLGSVTVINSTISRSQAWHNGGGLCTEMFLSNEDDTWRGRDETQFPFDLQTQLFIGPSTNFIDNRGAGRHLYVGPYFNLMFDGSTKAGNESLTAFSVGVTWRKRVCGKGEYVAPSGFCEQCAAFTYQMSGKLHRNTACPLAPNNTHAPGGAVIVPLTSNWHMVRPDTHVCDDQTVGSCTFPTGGRVATSLRCPNPSACEHDHKDLALYHPESTLTIKPHSWDMYSKLLCDVKQGYKGDLCGVCAHGFGMTSPFSCSRCLGVQVNDIQSVATGQLVLQAPIDKASLGGLYIFYCVALTAWCWFSVWTAVEDAEPQLPKASRTAAPTEASECGATSSAVSVSSSAAAASKQARHSDSAAAAGGGGGDEAKTVDADSVASVKEQACARCGAAPDERADPLDVVKAIMVYYQWFSVIMNLPLVWFPDAVLGFTKRAEESRPGTVFLGIIFGRNASLDCLLQAAGLWMGETTRDYYSRVFFISLVSAIGIPMVLLATVLIVWMAIHTFWRCFKCVSKPCCLPFRCCKGEEKQWEPCSSAAASMEMRAYFIQRLAITSLVLFFDNYDKTAQTALGMLSCVSVGSEPYPRRWVMDVRLPCPTEFTIDGWQKAAVAVGILLLLVCVCFPCLLASWLITMVHKGIITSEGTSHIPASKVFRNSNGWRVWRTLRRWLFGRTLRSALRFRYADYNIQYTLLHNPAAAPEAGALSAHNGGVSACCTTCCALSTWRSRISKFWRQLSLRQTQRWAVLCWDSILDLHRFLLALAALAVMLHEVHQVLLVMLVFSSYLVLILAARPYKCTTIWRLQVSALLVLLLSCFGIIACNIGDTSGFYEDAITRRYRIVVPWVVLGLNIAYFGFATYVLVRSVCHARKDKACACYKCMPRCSRATLAAAAH